MSNNTALLAANICLQVIDKGQSLDTQLQQAKTKLPVHSQPYLQELCYGVCRFYGYYDAIIARLLNKPIKSSQRIVHFVLTVALHQINGMKTPDYAVVDQSAKTIGQLKKHWAKGLVNGVLRQYLRKQKDFNDLREQQDALSFQHYLGQEIKKQWPEYYAKIWRYYNSYPPLMLRVNSLKMQRDDYMQQLQKQAIAAEILPESAQAIVLLQALPVEEVPGFIHGQVSVQDISAQFAAKLLKLAPNQNVLDACAAPGGKTGELLEAEPSINLTAIDLPQRTALIQENLDRLSLSACVIGQPLQEYSRQQKAACFDRILLDAPCSGSGVIARHPDIRYRRVSGDLEKFQAQQIALLQAAWPLLRQQGLLLYITCSVLAQENDHVITQFISSHDDVNVVDLVIDSRNKEQNIGLALQHGVQRLPGVDKGDGFYYCLLQKR